MKASTSAYRNNIFTGAHITLFVCSAKNSTYHTIGAFLRLWIYGLFWGRKVTKTNWTQNFSFATLSATAFVLGTEKVGQSPSQNVDYVRLSYQHHMRIDKVSANGATSEPRCNIKFWRVRMHNCTSRVTKQTWYLSLISLILLVE